MSTGNPAIDAIDQMTEHFDTLKPDSVATAEFIAKQSLLIQQVRTYVEGLLIESRHSQDGYKALQASYDELLQKHAKSQDRP